MKTVIFDLDGTLALIDHRKHFVEKEKAYHQYAVNAAVKSLRVHPQSEELVMSEDEFYCSWKPDWDAFFEACDKDEPNTPVIELLRMFKKTHKVLIYSGRSEAVFFKTEEWLRKYVVNEGVILRMRPSKDFTPDEVLKFQWFKQDFPDPSELFMVFDDRQKVVDMWRRNGITCLQVAPGDF